MNEILAGMSGINTICTGLIPTLIVIIWPVSSENLDGIQRYFADSGCVSIKANGKTVIAFSTAGISLNGSLPFERSSKDPQLSFTVPNHLIWIIPLHSAQSSI